MFRFGGFKASVNFISGKTSGNEQYDKSPGLSLNGAYRTNRDELFGSDLYTETSKKITPAMVKLPTKQSGPSINQAKSTNNLTKPSNEVTNTRKSAPDIPQAVKQPTRINVKEQKKLEKQRLAEQKKQEKLAEKERKREEKLRKEREKLIVQQRKAAQQQPKKEEQKTPKKRTAPQPQQQQIQLITPSISPQRQQNSTNTLDSSISKSSGPPAIQQITPSISPQRQQNSTNTLDSSISKSSGPPAIQQITPSISPQRQQNSTNTLDSSISKSSGPPPYTAAAPEVTLNLSDGTGNTSFAKPVADEDSWGLISQHREQLNRQAGAGRSAPKQKHLDLNFNGASMSTEKENSNA